MIDMYSQVIVVSSLFLLAHVLRVKNCHLVCGAVLSTSDVRQQMSRTNSRLTLGIEARHTDSLVG